MRKIVIAVGSTRKPKLNAVSAATNSFLELLCPGAQCEVVGIEVDSGVSHTPCTREELMRGARHRAEVLVEMARRERHNWDFSVGLEGGLDVAQDRLAETTRHDEVHRQPDHPKRRVLLESWAYVTNGQAGYFGRSGALEVPEALAHEVLDLGIELSVAIDRFAGAIGIRDAQGAWGVLSSNLVTRQEAFRVAVIAAFAPFYNKKIYQAASATAAQS